LSAQGVHDTSIEKDLTLTAVTEYGGTDKVARVVNITILEGGDSPPTLEALNMYSYPVFLLRPIKLAERTFPNVVLVHLEDGSPVYVREYKT